MNNTRDLWNKLTNEECAQFCIAQQLLPECDAFKPRYQQRAYDTFASDGLSACMQERLLRMFPHLRRPIQHKIKILGITFWWESHE